MASQAVSFVIRAFTGALDMFTELMQKTGLIPFYMAMVTVFFVIVYLISPFVVNSGSDTVRQDKNTNRKGSGRNG